MDTESEGSSSARKWWLLVGGIVAFAVVFTLLEGLVRKEPTPGEELPTAEDANSPSPPRVIRLDDGGIEIRNDFFRRTTIRLDSEEDEQALFDCLSQGIEETFADGTEGWDHSRIRSETQRIQNECMGLPGLPALPRLPQPGI